MYKRLVLLGTLILMVLGVSFTASADPRVGPITPENAIIGAAASDSLGLRYALLPSGNLVVVSTSWNSFTGIAACFTPEEYRAGGIVISAEYGLSGGTTGLNVGSGITVLSDGDYVITSTEWNDGITSNIGAVTWVDGETCIPYGATSRAAVVSPANSLIGVSVNDSVSMKVSALTNGNYVVSWSNWDNGANADAGAVTWASGDGSTVGTVSAANSLVGTLANSRVGSGTFTALANGNYVVSSPLWDSPTASNAGAVTWGNGNGGTVGEVSETNSLIGSTASDGIGTSIITLTNGNYVSYSVNWDNGGATNAGAVIWGNANGGTVGVVSAANALVGSTTDDKIGTKIIALTNGNYVTGSGGWDNGGAVDVGAATWGNGTTGIIGAVTSANSFVGDAAGAMVSGVNLTALSNGNYVIGSSYGSSTPANIGAVTLGNGATGLIGTLSPSNSLVGSNTDDLVGSNGITGSSDGDYIVRSSGWDNGLVVNAGAVTWCNGTTGCAGMVVSTANSVYGTHTSDNIGATSVTALSNGHFVVNSTEWDSDSAANVGAVTWMNGDGSTIGAVSSANSLTGSTAADRVGIGAVRALSNANYLVVSYSWAVDRGAVTWCNGTGGCVGEVSETNSVVGYAGLSITSASALSDGDYLIYAPLYDDGVLTDTGGVVWGNGDGGTVGEFGTTNLVLKGDKAGDNIGLGGLIVLDSGDYVVGSERWNNGAETWAGAVTLLKKDGTPVGAISAENSILGTEANSRVGQIDAMLKTSDGGFLVITYRWGYEGVESIGSVFYSEGFISPNLLSNGSFETAGATTKKADGWTITNAKSADRRLCTTLTKPITTTDEDCVFQFNSNATPEKARSLKQILTTGDLGTAGETLHLSAMVEGNKLKTGGKILVTVTYADLTTAKFNVALGSGTFDFTEKTGSLVLTQTVTKIVVNVKMAKVRGRVRLDDVNLNLEVASVLDFPTLITTRDGAANEVETLPEGFRN